MNIDVKIKMYSDSNKKDPDTFSEILHKYHGLLWEKILPNGCLFDLEKSTSSPYYFKSSVLNNKYIFSSDSIIHTYSRRQSMQKIVEKFPVESIEDFFDLASTIGGYIIFPANKVDNKLTINQIRGIHPKINDRFDLTLECIRLWYLGIESPLYNHLERYKDYFEMFANFKGYVDFFLLNDMVDEKYEKVNFWLPFKDFNGRKPIPLDEKEYGYYIDKITSFVNARNHRIKKQL